MSRTLPEPIEIDASAYLPEGIAPDTTVDTGLRLFVLKHHHAGVSAQLAIYYHGEGTYVRSIEHYGESPDDWYFEEPGISRTSILEWYVCGFIEDLLRGEDESSPPPTVAAEMASRGIEYWALPEAVDELAIEPYNDGYGVYLPAKGKRQSLPSRCVGWAPTMERVRVVFGYHALKS